jgi:hypothetical protein
MLRARERHILDAVVDTLIPPGRDGLGPSALEAGVPQRVDRYLLSLPTSVRRLFPFALWAIELYPLALGPGLRTFTSLSRARRTRTLERLEGHGLYPLRSAYLAVKVLAFLLWAEHPEVAQATGWGGRCS